MTDVGGTIEKTGRSGNARPGASRENRENRENRAAMIGKENA